MFEEKAGKVRVDVQIVRFTALTAECVVTGVVLWEKLGTDYEIKCEWEEERDVVCVCLSVYVFVCVCPDFTLVLSA